MPLSLLVLAGVACVLAWKSPLWRRTMPRNIQPLESLAWLGLALAGMTFMLIVGQAGRGWHSAWPLWQQRVLSLSLVIIATQGFTAAYYAAGAWVVAAFPPEGQASSEDYFAWSLCLFITGVAVAAWLGLVLEDTTGVPRVRLPLLVAGIGMVWTGWRAPPWFRGQPDLVRLLFGLLAARMVAVVLGVLAVLYALFGDLQRFYR